MSKLEADSSWYFHRLQRVLLSRHLAWRKFDIFEMLHESADRRCGAIGTPESEFFVRGESDREVRE